MDFGAPISCSGFWEPIAPRAAVPETAIDEHHQPPLFKDKIRFAWEFLAAAPSANSVLAHQTDEAEFRSHVPAAADSGHDARSLSPAEYVHYWFGWPAALGSRLGGILAYSASNKTM